MLTSRTEAAPQSKEQRRISTDRSTRRAAKVGQELSEEEGYPAAKSAGLAVLGSLKRTLGDLDRVMAY